MTTLSSQSILSSIQENILPDDTIEVPDSTTPSEFSSTTEIDSSKISHPTDFFYAIKDSWVQDLGFQLAFLYSMIISLSTKNGYCFMQDKTFAQRMNVSLRTIERWMNKLEEKKYIYRNTFQSKQGKKRHIVPKTNYIDYWQNFLNRECVPSDVKKNFLETVLQHQPPRNKPSPIEKTSGMNRHQEPKDRPPDKSGGSYATDKNGGSLLLRNSNSKRERQTKSESDRDVVVSFEDLIEKELTGLGVSGDRLKMAIEYYTHNKEMVDGKKNPMGWIIQGVQKGWIADVVKKEKVVREKEQTKEALVFSAEKLEKFKEIASTFVELLDLEKEQCRDYVAGIDMFCFKDKRGRRVTFFYREDKDGRFMKILASIAVREKKEKAFKFIEQIMRDKPYEGL